MTAEEIRKVEVDSDQIGLLREIAAQLAEFNAMFRRLIEFSSVQRNGTTVPYDAIRFREQ